MSKDIRIKKGMDIKLKGEAEKNTKTVEKPSVYGICPSDFHNVTPKLIVREGTQVEAGDAIFCDKNDQRVVFASPVSGVVKEIVRGDRRKVLEIKIEPTQEIIYKKLDKKDPNQMSEQEIKQYLLGCGLWPFIKQRPYDVIAHVDKKPKHIFISACKTNPLAPDYSYVVRGKEKYIQTAVNALKKLTQGKVHVSVFRDDAQSPFNSIENVEKWNVVGPHPAGNVSTQIAHISPINKGEVVWVVSPADLLVIGEAFEEGRFNLRRKVALTGSGLEQNNYAEIIAGAKMGDVLKGNLKENTRVISGDVLTGKNAGIQGYLSYYDDQITCIPEGNDYQLFGWLKPVFDKISPTRAMTFGWMNKNKEYDLDTNTNGEQRAFVVTGIYEEVFPLDIYPMQLLKSCLYKDLDEMENLGAYEVAPEDFALTEFVCISKQPHQKIIRDGLDLMMKELG